MTRSLAEEVGKTLTVKDLHNLVARHHNGDWGDISIEDSRANEEALETGLRVFSSYKIGNGYKIWIITEADRSYTTVMFPEDY